MAINNRQAEIGNFRAILSDPVEPLPIQQNAMAVENPSTPVIDQASQVGMIQPKALRGLLQSIENKKKKSAATAKLASRFDRRLLTEINSNAKMTLLPATKPSIPTRHRTPAHTPTPPPTSPVIQMELIREGKRRVEVTEKGIENTPSKRMRVRE